MKILVAIKPVIDYNNNYNIINNNLNNKNLKFIINPFDEIALEEAIRLKENNLIKKNIVVSCGTLKIKNILTKAIAMGIDESILINYNKKLYPLNTSILLKNIIKKKNPNLVILGKQSIDYDNYQIGQILSGLLNWPIAISINKLIIKNKKIIITKEIDLGLETIILILPAIITVDLKLNEPRYINLINMIEAKKKKIKIINYNKIKLKKNNKIIKMYKVKKNKKKIKIINIKELINIIKNKNI